MRYSDSMFVLTVHIIDEKFDFRYNHVLASIVESVSFVFSSSIESFVFDYFDKVEVVDLFEWVFI